MPFNLPTLVAKIPSIPNKENMQLVQEMYDYMQEMEASVNHKINTLKVMLQFASHLGANTTFFDVKDKKQIIAYLDKKINTQGPDERWRTT